VPKFNVHSHIKLAQKLQRHSSKIMLLSGHKCLSLIMRSLKCIDINLFAKAQ